MLGPERSLLETAFGEKKLVEDEVRKVNQGPLRSKNILHPLCTGHYVLSKMGVTIVPTSRNFLLCGRK
jgi:hypothetical protein